MADSCLTRRHNPEPFLRLFRLHQLAVMLETHMLICTLHPFRLGDGFKFRQQFAVMLAQMFRHPAVFY